MLTFPPVHAVPHNLTTPELVREIEHLYPHLAGPLLELKERVRLGRTNELATGVQPAPNDKCPHCGTPYSYEGEAP